MKKVGEKKAGESKVRSLRMVRVSNISESKGEEGLIILERSK